LIFKELSEATNLTKMSFLQILCDLSKKNDTTMQFEKKTKSYRHIISNIIYIVFEKLLFEIVERINGQFEPMNNGKWISIVEFPGFRNKEENGFDDLHINYLNERLLLFYMESILSLEKVKSKEVLRRGKLGKVLPH
jgi:myosin heavy subunit